MEYYKWLVKKGKEWCDTTLYFMDWFAPNLDPSVDKFFDACKKAICRIPGCTTGIVQPNDVALHHPLNVHYRNAEILDANVQLKLGVKMPTTSRADCIDRSLQAWGRVNHKRVTDSFVEVGIANKLNGTEDWRLNREAAEFWHADGGMSAEREKVKAEVKAKVDTKEITCFSQYIELLEDYGPMRVHTEGQECFEFEYGPGDDELDVDEDEDATTDVEWTAADDKKLAAADKSAPLGPIPTAKPEEEEWGLADSPVEQDASGMVEEELSGPESSSPLFC